MVLVSLCSFRFVCWLTVIVAQLWIVKRLTIMSIAKARRVQMFVAGALALMGFRALVWLPHYCSIRDSVLIIGCLVVGLGLPLGVAILVGSLRAVRLAEVYLWLGVIGMVATLVVFALHVLPADAPRTSWRSIPDLIIPLVLLALLVWSRFPRHEPDA